MRVGTVTESNRGRAVAIGLLVIGVGLVATASLPSAVAHNCVTAHFVPAHTSVPEADLYVNEGDCNVDIACKGVHANVDEILHPDPEPPVCY